jgi:hypothetical protein
MMPKANTQEAFLNFEKISFRSQDMGENMEKLESNFARFSSSSVEYI